MSKGSVVNYTAQAPALARRRKPSKSSRKGSRDFYVFISPWLVGLVVLTAFPFLMGLYLSFTNYSGFNFGNLKWVGFENYKFVFTDSDAMASLMRTFIITVINVPLGLVIGFLLAVLLNAKGVKGLSVYRTIFYLPSILPITSTMLIWSEMLATNGGFLNEILGVFGLGPYNWGGYLLARPSLILVLLWGAGGGLLIYLAGLKGVSQSLYESAAIDGASVTRQFWHITVPMMTPVLFFNLITGFVGAMQILLQPILLSGQTSLVAPPSTPIYLFMDHAWLQIFLFHRFSYGLALIWVMFIIVLILGTIIFITSNRWVHYESSEE
jgi:multiple sugar transport system permease protein